ncbi:penicillin acylase family protein, partial [Kallotenue papyrolyticum]|uniref:penicillin acylase family protein n=1 Tax=Kallotenue papyrolyticum TaxID=1325125 RepID=UPI000492352B
RLDPSIMAVLPQGNYDALLALNTELRALLGVAGFSSEGLGSNNWVISGARSTTGYPLLANDPHLGARLPSIWFLAHLSAPDFEVIGATLPGVPGFPIGRNRTIAWGVTNVGPDVQDLYRERIDPSGRMAEFQGSFEPMQIITETIEVAGSDPVTHTVRITRHGPLISDAININRAETAAAKGSERMPALEPLALRWTALDPDDTTIDAFLGINQARSWEEFRTALRAYVAPAQNFVYADVAGNIGYYAPGRYPIRAGGNGLLPAEGWSSRQEWLGYVPFEEQPHVFNPPQGFIVTANNRPTPPDYPYDLGHEWALPYRYQRIVALIQAKDRLSLDDLAAIQTDTVSLHARELLPHLLELLGSGDDATADAIELLRRWDGDMRGDSPAAAIFQAWYWRLPRAIAGDELGTQLMERYQGEFTLSRAFVGAALAQPDNPWCDDTGSAARETCADIVRSALEKALDELRGRLGADMRRWRWDRLHVALFPHQPLDSVPVLRWLLSRSVPYGGDHSTVNVGPFSFEAPFRQTHVPGYRQLVDLADPNAGRFIHAGGQSGHFLSPFYDDYLADWQAGRYRPMWMDREQIQTAGATTLWLEPAAP